MMPTKKYWAKVSGNFFVKNFLDWWKSVSNWMKIPTPYYSRSSWRNFSKRKEREKLEQIICTSEQEPTCGTPTNCLSVWSAASDKVNITSSSTIKTESYTKEEKQSRSLLASYQTSLSIYFQYTLSTFTDAFGSFKKHCRRPLI